MDLELLQTSDSNVVSHSDHEELLLVLLHSPPLHWETSQSDSA